MIAFFDLDKTLLAVNSLKLWVRRELRLGHVTRVQALEASAWIAAYHLGFVEAGSSLKRAISMLAGTAEREIRARTRDFYEEELRQQYRPGALSALKAHREQGHRVVLLTSSSDYLSELVGDELGLDGLLCNRFEIDPGGLHTGRALGTVCYGEGKLRHAESYASAQGVELAACAFYTDSYSDLPVLERVGTPVAVNPDQRLRRLAHRRGWRVVDWGVPASPLGTRFDKLTANGSSRSA